MRQQINLYRDELIDRVEPLSGKQAALILVLSLVFVIALGSYGYWRGHELEPQRVQLEHRRQQLRSLVSELELEFPERQASPLLQQRVARLEQEHNELERTLDFVLSREQGRNSAMLATLEGLARQRHAGLWLNQVHLARQGLDVELTGRAFTPDLVPDYLQWLVDEDIFSGLIFNRLRLSRLQEYPGHVEFTIGTGTAGAR
ncbi:MAG: hypothetical protein R6V33_11115 [Pelovirga sp.]